MRMSTLERTGPSFYGDLRASGVVEWRLLDYNAWIGRSFLDDIQRLWSFLHEVVADGFDEFAYELETIFRQ